MGRGNFYADDGEFFYVGNDRFMEGAHYYCKDCMESFPKEEFEATNGEHCGAEVCPECKQNALVYHEEQWGDWLFHDFVAEVQTALPKSFAIYKQKEWKWRDDICIVADGDYCSVGFADNDSTTAICILRNELEEDEEQGDNGLRDAMRESLEGADAVKELLIKHLLNQGYDLYLRSGAWTSSKIDPRNYGVST